jgi:trehalose 6-phosphate synthase
MTSADLVRTMADRLRDTKLVVVANRQPYVHEKQVTVRQGFRRWVFRQGDKVRINWKQPASGLVTALDPVMQACGGTWVAHGNGSGDLEASDPSGRLAVPPDKPRYSLRRVWLKPQEESGYYYGVSNNALWPLCHIAYARPVFNQGDWRQYVAVNRRFADVVLEEIAGTRAIVFVQDYHYALLPRFVKAARPDAVVCQFWHIPWPNPEAFRILPWQSEVLDGLLGNDLLGFHLQYHCNNFLETVDRSMEARIDQETFSVYCRGHRTAIRPYPISIDPSTWNGTSPGSAWTREAAATRRRLDVGDRRIVMGVDRLDYTKGIPDRLLAFDRFLERYPEWRGRVVLVQVGSPTRDRIDRYRDLSREVGELVEKINTRHGMPGWIPIVYRREYHTPKDVAALYRATDVCVVSSLHDGMNLVAKEFVAARTDNRGVLLLSKFAGAARELSDALQVNPFAPDEFAETLHAALSMGPGEAERRMRALRAQVCGHTVFDWAARVLCDACRVADGRG